MAELILTAHERSDKTYLDWDDEALGKLVRKTALMIDDHYGNVAAMLSGATLLLTDAALESNSDTFRNGIEGCTKRGEDVGDWMVIIERTRKPYQSSKSVTPHATNHQGATMTINAGDIST